MVSGKLRSRRLRRIAVTTPGGKKIIRRVRRKPSPATCGSCGARLAGVPRQTKVQARTAPKSTKRPERPFGGVFCPSCSREHILRSARASAQQSADGAEVMRND